MTVAIVALAVVKSTSLTDPVLGMADTVQLDDDPPTVNEDGEVTVVTAQVGTGVGVGVGGTGVGVAVGTGVGVATMHS